MSADFLGDCNVDVTGLGSASFDPTPTPPFEVTDVQVSVNPTSHGHLRQAIRLHGADHGHRLRHSDLQGSAAIAPTWPRGDRLRGPGNSGRH